MPSRSCPRSVSFRPERGITCPSCVWQISTVHRRASSKPSHAPSGEKDTFEVYQFIIFCVCFLPLYFLLFTLKLSVHFNLRPHGMHDTVDTWSFPKERRKNRWTCFDIPLLLKSRNICHTLHLVILFLMVLIFKMGKNYSQLDQHDTIM